MRVMTPEQAGEARRAGILKKRMRAIGRLATSLTPAERIAYLRWERLCRKFDIPVTPEARYEYLTDLKEMPQ